MSQFKVKPVLNPLKAEISIPGSKSYTNRALLLGALVKGEMLINKPLLSDDILAMVNCLKALGINVEEQGKDVVIKGSIFDVQDQEFKLNADLSGTTIRFLTALSTIIPGTKIISGKEGLNKRPISELVNALKQLGAEIEYLGKEGYPPLKVTSSSLNPGKVLIAGDVSSQFLSALLMISPMVGDIEIQVTGSQVSTPYIDMTLDLMETFGVKIENHNYEKYFSPKKNYIKDSYVVEGDFSSAGYFFALAALTESDITVLNLNPHSKQADRQLLKVLEQMGSKVDFLDQGIRIQGHGVKAMNIDVENFPDQAQTLAVLLSFAQGKSVLRGVQTLRVKETERVKALETELQKMEIKTESTEDTLTIYGGNPKGAEIDTYSDHRMAMSFALAGTKLDNLVINNPEVVSKTFPDFWEKLESIGVQIERLIR